jgi:hypothetical protein
MSIFIILGLIFLFFIRRLASKLEYSAVEYPNGYYGAREVVWHDLKFPLWVWILITLFLCVPILGIILYIVAWIFLPITINIGSLRFKERKHSVLVSFLKKIVDLLNKKY